MYKICPWWNNISFDDVYIVCITSVKTFCNKNRLTRRCKSTKSLLGFPSVHDMMLARYKILKDGHVCNKEKIGKSLEKEKNCKTKKPLPTFHSDFSKPKSFLNLTPFPWSMTFKPCRKSKNKDPQITPFEFWYLC